MFLNRHVFISLSQGAGVSWRAILQLYLLLSLSFPSGSFGGEEPIITGPKADSRFYDSGVFPGVHVAIGKILQYPDAYDLRLVILKGTVKRVELYHWPDELVRSQSISYLQLRCKGNSMPLYTFILEDDTGSLEVGVRSSLSCFLGNVPYPIQMGVTDGDQIIAEVQIGISNIDAAGQNHRTPGALFGRGKRITE